MKKAFKIIGLVLISLLAVTVLVGLVKDIRPIFFGLHSAVYQSSGKALEGYDVVSYFKGNPVKGSEAYSLKWMDATWNFSSQENMDAFKANPTRYTPQFGGYCTKAVSTGFTAPSDPSIYAIWDHKLFIFSSEDVKAEFLSNPDDIISACRVHWN
jgi:YHS domain-containing protein